jgi:hypothetical protein
MKFFSEEYCRRKADQHWELAGLARKDRDKEDSARHTNEAQKWDIRARDGGYWED